MEAFGREFTVDFESRYYRTCGLRIWFGWDHGPYVLWPYVPTEAENRALDARNAAAMEARASTQQPGEGECP